MPTEKELWEQIPKEVLDRKLRILARTEHPRAKAALARLMPQTVDSSAWSVFHEYGKWLWAVKQCVYGIWQTLGKEVTQDFRIAVLERAILPRLSKTNKELLDYVSWVGSNYIGRRVDSPLDAAAILDEIELQLPDVRQRWEDRTTDSAWHESVTRERQESAAPETVGTPAEPSTGTAQPTGKQEGRPVFRKTGDFWEVSYAGKTFHLRDTRGLHFISRLLREPGKEILARELAVISDSRSQGPMGNELPASAAVLEGELSDSPNMGDTGEVSQVLDRSAIDAYKAHLKELSADRIEAEKEPNPAWLAQIEEETKFIERELRAGTGRGGKARNFALPRDKARSSGTHQIKAAIKKVSENNPDLGSHLDRTIKTGTYCSYQPDPTADIDWAL